MTRTDHPWRHRAACTGRNTNYWFPETKTANTPAAALAIQICNTCPVTTECLQHAMNTPETFGIWGGTTEQQRRGLRRTAQGHTIPHGTERGYVQHALWGQPVCPPCRAAHAKYQAACRRIRQRAKTRHNNNEPGETHDL
jgi:WhiB family redox-sensing transcriptional regulator